MATVTTWAELFGGVFPEESLVQDGTVYGPLGNDLTGTGLVSLLPTDIEGGSVYALVGSTKAVSVTCLADIEGLTIEVVLETVRKTDVAIVADASITKAGVVATFTLPAEATSVERVLTMAVRTTSGIVLAQRTLFVSYASKQDD